MIQSLLDNAVTFTTGNQIVLSVKRGGGNVTMTVEDNGAGVAPEDLARIQEPFEHAGRSEGADHAKGAGLGLTLVKAFAELHGGALELDSQPGSGFLRLDHGSGGVDVRFRRHLRQILVICDSITRRV